MKRNLTMLFMVLSLVFSAMVQAADCPIPDRFNNVNQAPPELMSNYKYGKNVVWGELDVWTRDYQGDRKSWKVSGPMALGYDFEYLAGDGDGGEEHFILTPAKSVGKDGTLEFELIYHNTKYMNCVSESEIFRIPEGTTCPISYNDASMGVKIKFYLKKAAMPNEKSSASDSTPPIGALASSDPCINTSLSVHDPALGLSYGMTHIVETEHHTTMKNVCTSPIYVNVQYKFAIGWGYPQGTQTWQTDGPLWLQPNVQYVNSEYYKHWSVYARKKGSFGTVADTYIFRDMSIVDHRFDSNTLIVF
jgi:hypothetical protein